MDLRPASARAALHAGRIFRPGAAEHLHRGQPGDDRRRALRRRDRHARERRIHAHARRQGREGDRRGRDRRRDQRARQRQFPVVRRLLQRPEAPVGIRRNEVRRKSQKPRSMAL